MTPPAQRILIIGGTGAQGIPVVTSLTQDGKYTCRVLTRDTTSSRARHLTSLPGVELFEGSFLNQDTLRKAYDGCDGAFVNIDGFNTGEKGEIYWAIRVFELAIENGGIRFFVYGNLDYGYKKSGYRPEFRSGHYDGKGRAGEWILSHSQAATKGNGLSNMKIALFTTGPYIDQVVAGGNGMTPTIEKNESNDDVVTWRVPLGENGAIAHVCLDDCGYYVRWLFDHPDEADGLNLEVAIEHIRYEDLATAFTKVTGHPARFVDIDLEAWWQTGPMSAMVDVPVGYNADIDDGATMSMKENFSGFWRLWQKSGGNKGIIQRDYALLDRIHPKRIRSVEEWLKVENKRGIEAGKGSLWDRVQPEGLRPVLKLQEDGWKDPAKSI